MEEDLHIGHGKRDLLKVEKIIPKAIGLFKGIVKRHFFPREKYFGLSPNKRKEPPRPKSSLG